MLKISEIRINHIKEPKGIWDNLNIGWKMTSEKKNVKQKNYQIQIFEDSKLEKMIYDTGKVFSENSQNIWINISNIYLKSIHYYYVRVKVWDTYGENSDWSVTRFLTALLEERNWQADFITVEQPKDEKGSIATRLRREFRVEKPLKEAFLVFTAYGLYQTFLNGMRVGKNELAPGWTSYHNRLLYQIYDVTDQIQDGVNTWSALVGAGWYKGDISYYRIHNFYGKYAAISGELLLRYEDGSEEAIYTDKRWKGTESAILFSDIYDGEIYDARLGEEKWKENGYQDEAWREVRVVEQRKEQLYPQLGSTVKVQERLAVKEIILTPNGETVLDFGQNISGWVDFSVDGKPGDIVEFVCFEMLDAAGNVYTKNLRTAKQTIRYICSGEGMERYRPHFTFQGFRYVWVKQYPNKILKDNFKALVLYSSMREIGTFCCSNPLLNQLQKNILWGLKGNSVDIPSDCPQRDERLGWTGDVQVFCNTACYLMDMYEFYRKWLCDLSADQEKNGAVTHVVPDVLSLNQPDNFSGAVGWGDVAVVLPWVLYQETADKTIIHQQYHSMKSWIDFMVSRMEDGEYRFGFGDWLALDAKEGSYHGATPVELTSEAYFAYSVWLFIKMARVIEEDRDVQTYNEIYKTVVQNFQEKYFLSDGQMSVQTQTAHVLALGFGLVPRKYKKKTIDNLICLLKKYNMHLSTGFLGTPLLMHVLSENGYVSEAYELLLKKDFPSWLYQIERGATTVWEHWDGLKPDGSMWSPDMNSFNHYAYGAIGSWLYEVCAGLKRDENEPGYKHFYIEPYLGGNLEYAKTTHLSEYGNVLVHWIKKEKQVRLKIEVPHNATATIVLSQADKIVEDGGLLFTKRKGILTADTGSGGYKICYTVSGV